MGNLCWMRFVLLVTIGISSVNSLASLGSFGNLHRQCFPNGDRFDQNRLPGQTIPTGMTLNSFIDTVERLERKYVKTNIQAHRSALAFLRWFSLPDYEYKFNQRIEQPAFYMRRYDEIERLFRDQLQIIADLQRVDGTEEIPQEDLNDICFMMRVLSHTYVNECSMFNGNGINNDNNDNRDNFDNRNSPNSRNYNTNRLPLGQNLDDSNFNNQRDSNAPQQNRFSSNANTQRQRGAPLGRPNMIANVKSQMPNQQAAVPNVRESQVNLLSYTRTNNQNCLLREDGVVSITGQPNDAISMAPVLLGIAASKMDRRGGFSFLENGDEFNDNFNRAPVNPLFMATLGQEIGTAAFLRLDEESLGLRRQSTHDLDVTGQWNRTGCLQFYNLNSRRSVAYTRAQMSGAVDGAIIGSMMSRSNFDGFSLADILRLYYHGSNVRGDSQVTSVCNRDQAFDSLEKNTILAQARLMTERLASMYGILDRMSNSIDSQVNEILGSINPSDWRSMEMCPTTNVEKCTSQADVFVVLDPSSSSSPNRNLQAEILGRIVNGMEFREQRNSVRVYSGFSGTNLHPVPENSQFQGQTEQFGITSSGCPACIAEYLQSAYESRFAGDRELFIAINGTINRWKSLQNSRTQQSATAGRVVLIFRMSPEPIQDAQSAADALMSMRMAHPEVRLIAIGDEITLKQINDLSGGLTYYDSSLLKRELENWNQERESGSMFAEIKRMICETPIYLQNVQCLGSRETFNGNANNNNNNNNGNNNNLNNNNNNNRNTNNMRNNNNNRLNNGGMTFRSGVNVGRVQFVSYDSYFFAGSRDPFSVQFSSGNNGHVKVCEISSQYVYDTAGRSAAISNNNNNNRNNNNNNNNNNLNKIGSNWNCLQTSPSQRTIAFNYTRRCYDGRRSCAALNYAVVGLESSSRNLGSCIGAFCETPLAVAYNVFPEGMVCASSSLIASVSLVIISLIAAMRLA